MALPKRKISRTRRDKRRTHWKLFARNVVECKNCHEPRLPHHACPNCGFYKNREVIVVKEA